MNRLPARSAREKEFLWMGHRLAQWGKFLPLLFMYQAVGCLPDDSIRQVFGENVVFTAAIVIQTITSIVFNTLFGVA